MLTLFWARANFHKGGPIAVGRLPWIVYFFLSWRSQWSNIPILIEIYIIQL